MRHLMVCVYGIPFHTAPLLDVQNNWHLLE